MIRKTILMAGVVALAAATAQAQDPRVEISGTAGWTFSDGVNVGTSEDVIRLDPKDAFSWGVRLGFMVSPNIEVGALFNMQATDLDVDVLGDKEKLGDQTLYNYHGYFAYNFGDSDASVRPYLLGGVGATQFGSLDIKGLKIDGETKFSTTWAAGVKIFPSPRFGIRLEGRWTPTYVKTDPEGYWCGYYTCVQVGESVYANQFELSSGITLRF